LHAEPWHSQLTERCVERTAKRRAGIFKACGLRIFRYTRTAKSLKSNTTVGAARKGLIGQYYNNVDLTSPVARRLDPTIDFSWSIAGPGTVAGR
jgi:hypothetical protein